MKILVVGASGATGRLLVKQLLEQAQQVVAVVRPSSHIPESIANHPELTVVRTDLLKLSDDDLKKLVEGCDAIASCLGHNLTFKGMYGHPRRLVTDSVRRLCHAAEATLPIKPVKFVLMNSTGNSNRDIPETISFAQRCVMALLRLLVPPHVDNEKAADFLRCEVGQNNPHIEWVVVRPDSLVNEQTVSEYVLYPSPIRSAIFDAGRTSRINVANFMQKLIRDHDCWQQWRGKMPVIYNLTDD